MAQPRVRIIGAGFGGIAAAIELRRHGFEDVALLEKAPTLGGTWFYNRYPECACDLPSHLYSFSFAQRRDWSRICSPQAEILRYLQGVAREHGVEQLVVGETEIAECAWEEDRGRWVATSTDGRSFAADALIIATGQLHRPAVPRLPGAERFAGESFHSSRWPAGFDARGKRVAVIGTGASAVQFIPELARAAERLYVFQRSPNWFLPRRNRAYPALLKTVFRRVPGVQSFRRRFIFWYAEMLTAMIRHPRTLGRVGRAYSSAFMRLQLKDPEVRRRAWPDYPFGCKRVLFSSHYLLALQRAGVELVTERISQLTPLTVITADGAEREVDVLIYATGFCANEFMAPMVVRGREGRTLAEAWAAGAHAHLGITVPGFPSLFLVYGPNTNTSGGSIIFYEEAQAGYIRQALELLRERRTAIEVRAEVEAASNRELQARFNGTAWVACQSWYREHGKGRIVANWPGHMRDYQRHVAELDPHEYVFAPVPAGEPTLALE